MATADSEVWRCQTRWAEVDAAAHGENHCLVQTSKPGQSEEQNVKMVREGLSAPLVHQRTNWSKVDAES